jgi:type IV secretion system protein VirB8
MSSALREPELEAYFSEAASWDRDRIEQVQRSARNAWRVAAAAASCALAASAALTLLLPLKRVEPFVVRVDSSSGVVDVVPVYVGKAPLEESVTRYFLNHYVSVCERFNFSTAESDYEECGAFHSAQRNQLWYALWNPSNPASPLNLHKDGSVILAQVESISFFKRAGGVDDLAQVRYLKTERQGAGAQGRVSHWIATIRYAYTAPAANAGIRRWNPLGFKVLEFVTEEEVLREPLASAPAHAGGASP